MDVSQTIAPKTDQLNSDDLIGGRTLTITITKVTGGPAASNQPVELHYQGGKPYRPCLSMRRVLVNVWGADGASYVGRSLTLYRDDKVMFGGVAVGGLRISHMSHMPNGEMTMALTASKAKRAPYCVKPLLMQGQSHAALVKTLTDGYEQCSSQDEFDSLEKKRADAWKALNEAEKKSLKAASDAAKVRVAPAAENNGEDALEVAIREFESLGGIFDEFAENNKISAKAIKASRGDARASWAKLIAGETELLKGSTR